MTPHAHVDRPAFGVDLLEQQAMLPGLDDELVLARQQQLAVGFSSGSIQKRLGRLGEKRRRLRVIADLTVGKPMEVLGRDTRCRS